MEEALVKVTLTYNTGKKITMTGLSLEEWVSTWATGMRAMATLAQMERDGQLAPPSNIINLQDAINKKKEEEQNGNE